MTLNRLEHRFVASVYVCQEGESTKGSIRVLVKRQNYGKKENLEIENARWWKNENRENHFFPLISAMGVREWGALAAFVFETSSFRRKMENLFRALSHFSFLFFRFA